MSMHAQTMTAPLQPRRRDPGCGHRCVSLAMATHVWLLRHGEAEPRGTRPDSRRALTERGARQARAAGIALARRRIQLNAVFTSPRVRARDTARLACESLKGLEPTTYQPLSAGFDGRQA